MKRTPQQQLEALELAYIRYCKNGTPRNCHQIMSDAKVSARFVYAIFTNWDHFVAYMHKKNPSLTAPLTVNEQTRQLLAQMKRDIQNIKKPPTAKKKGKK